MAVKCKILILVYFTNRQSQIERIRASRLKGGQKL